MKRKLKDHLSKTKQKRLLHEDFVEILQKSFSDFHFDLQLEKFIQKLLDNNSLSKCEGNGKVSYEILPKFWEDKEPRSNLKNLYFWDEKSILSHIYEVIKKAGAKGLTHEEIILKSQSKFHQGLQLNTYLSSHYCIKLRKLGLVYQSINHESKPTWKRVFISNSFKNQLQNNLLAKKELQIEELEGEEEEEKQEQKHNCDCQNQLMYLQNHCDYDITLSLE